MGKPVTMTENRLAIRRAFLDGKINAVCGYPGIGKTYLTMIHYWEMAERVAQPTCVPCLRGKTPVVMVRCTRAKTIVRI